MMDRKECLKAIARHVTDTDIVLPVYSTAFDWIDIRPSALNYLSHGAMGLASSHALGLALGRPDRRVIVLDGDGSLLMNIGTLVSIAEAAPKNLYHFVMENGTYEANGGHPIPGKGAVSFAGMARSAGHKNVHEFADLKVFDQQAGAILADFEIPDAARYLTVAPISHVAGTKVLPTIAAAAPSAAPAPTTRN